MLTTAHLFLVLAPQKPQIGLHEFFAWADQQGYQAAVKKPFVKVIETRFLPLAKCYGFLLSQDKSSFRVLNTALAVEVFSRKVNNIFVETYQFRSADFDQNVRETLATKIGPDGFTAFSELYHHWPYDPKSDTHESLSFSEDLSIPNATLAYICSRKGKPQDAARFLKRIGPKNDIDGLRDKARTEIGGMEFDSIMRQFENPDRTRPEILALLKKSAPKFRGLPRTKIYDDDIATLTRMIAEEKTHVPSKDHIVERMWKLRNETSNAGFIIPDQAIDDLAKIGLPAVPALLNAIMDRSFTRSQFNPDMHSWQGFTEGDNIRVGDVAIRALDRISQLDLETVETRKEADTKARTWFRYVQVKGEKAVLIEGVLRNDLASYRQVRKLVKAYPKDAFKPLAMAFKTADEDHRQHLVSALKNIKSPECYAFARQVMKDDKAVLVRLEAAKHLAPFDGDTVINAMWGEWKLQPKRSKTCSEIAVFLCGSLRVDVIKRLQKELSSYDPGKRYIVIRSIHMPNKDDWHFNSKMTPHAKREWQRCIEDILASRLNDQDRTSGFMGPDGMEFINTTVAEMAAYFLDEEFPKIYHFTKTKSKTKERRQELNMLKIYRSRR